MLFLILENFKDKYYNVLINMLYIINNLGIGDWGLGIGQSPIPNPQSPN